MHSGKRVVIDNIVRSIVPKDVKYSGKPYNKQVYMQSFSHEALDSMYDEALM
jgi:hypothetical protein